MTLNGYFQLILYMVVLIALVKPLGLFMARVYQGEPTFLDRVIKPVERIFYRLAGVSHDEEMDWKTYAIAMLVFNIAGLFVVYALQRLQAVLPLNPQALPAVSGAPPCSRAAGQAFYDQVKRAGLSVDDVYRRHEEFFGLHDLAERLLDFDERMQLFRFHHLKLAERVIGGRVVGTMGTPVEVLQQRMEHWLYKDLWDVRNQITAAANQSQGGRQY